MSNVTLISHDHGSHFERMNVDNKHVDDHAIAFNSDPDYPGVFITGDGREIFLT